MLLDALLRANFRARGPWVTRFQINGRNYGGWYDYTNDHRVRDFVESFEPCRVLELGCAEGGQTIELAQRGYRVTALEGRQENVKRARWICRLFRTNALILGADLETARLSEFGRFDVVFCSGLLYHLPRPRQLIEQLPAVAPNLFLSTHYAEQDETASDGIAGRWYSEGGRRDPLSGLSERSFWPTRSALLELLRASGYNRIEVMRDCMHPNGPLLNLVARIVGRGED